MTSYLDGRPSGDVAKDVEAVIQGIPVPSGYRVRQGGEAEDQGEAFGQIFQALGLSMVLMYLLMVVLFGGLLYPLVVMLSLPLAVVGAFGLLALWKAPPWFVVAFAACGAALARVAGLS